MSAADTTSAPKLGPSAPARLRSAAAETKFRRAAGWVLAFTLFVILFGAVVRITGSGAGCGQHWPTCHGEVAHLPKTLETLIELTHRITSGLSAFFVLGLAVAALRLYGRGHAVLRATLVASFFMLVEALIGAMLVRLELVGSNASTARAIVMPLHLVSTSILTGALAVAFWWARPPAANASHPVLEPAARKSALRLLAFGLAGLLIVSGFGALTALGDTLYPVPASGISERLRGITGSHSLERLRVLHPVLAVLLAVFLLASVPRLRDPLYPLAARKLAGATCLLVGAQMLAGGINVLLSAPGWMQVLHLLLACLLWLSMVVLVLEIWAPRTIT